VIYTFSRFDTIPECKRHTQTDTQTVCLSVCVDCRIDRHTTTAYTALSIA